MKLMKTLLAATALCSGSAAFAADLEVTHW